MSARRQYSDKHSLPANPTWIEFSRSDGDSSQWPQNTTRAIDSEGHVNFMRPIELDEPLCVKWRVEVASAVAVALKYPEGTAYALKSWPDGYRMFDHHKGRAEAPRHDAYLMGSKSRFRSVPEFVPHAIWLMSDPSMDRSNCECKYCGKKKSQREITQSMASILPKRVHTGSPSPSSHTPRTRETKPSTAKSREAVARAREQRVRRETKAYAAVQKMPKLPKAQSDDMHPMARERNSDLRAIYSQSGMQIKRWFRDGELVWCSLEPPIAGPRGGSDDIKFWPGIVEEANVKAQAVPRVQGDGQPSVTGQGDTSANSSELAAEAPPPWTVRQSTWYKVRLLAVSHIYFVSDRQVVPYQAYVPDDDLIAAMRSFPSNQLDLDSKTMTAFNPCPPLEGAEPPDQPRKAAPPRTFENAVSPFAVALQIGVELAGFWSLTDEWDFKYQIPRQAPVPSRTSGTGISSLQSAIIAAGSNNATLHRNAATDPGSISSGPPKVHRDISGARPGMSQEELQQLGNRVLGPPPPPGQSYTQRRFQGLWWGAERIWTDELVRLKLARGSLAPSGAENIYAPSGSTASTRGVFMRLDGLFVADVPLPDGGTKKECRASGTLYELADEDWVETNENKDRTVAVIPNELPPNSSANPDPSPMKPPPLPNFDPSVSISATSSSVLAQSLPPPPPSQQPSTSQLSQPPYGTPYPLPPAPKGFRFRAILPPGYESVMSLSLISGRYYPQILAHPLLDAELRKAFAAPLEQGGILVGNNLWALEGLAAGFYNSVDPTVFKPDRPGMLRDADAKAREELGRHVEQARAQTKEEEPDMMMEVDVNAQ